MNKTPFFNNVTKAALIVAFFVFIFLFFAFGYENRDFLSQIGFWASAAVGIATSILFTSVWLTRKQITAEQVEKSEKMRKIQKSMYATACLFFALHCFIMLSIFNFPHSYNSYQNAITYVIILSFAIQLATLAIEAIFHSDRCY